MRYIFVLWVIALAPNFYCKTASTEEISESVPIKPLLEEKEAEDSRKMPKQSTGQDVTGEHAEAGSLTPDSAGVDFSRQSEENGNKTGTSPETVQDSSGATSSATEILLLPEVLVYGNTDSLLGIVLTVDFRCLTPL